MEYSILGALVGGLVATIVMSAMMKTASAMGMTRMPPMHQITGAMFSGDESVANKIGIVVHYLMMGTVVFGLIYGAIIAAVGANVVLTAVVVGLVHGLVVGGMAMPMMPAMHPRMGDVPITPEGATVTQEQDELHLSSPGFFGARWGRMTPAGVIMGHVVYGLVLGLVYLLFV